MPFGTGFGSPLTTGAGVVRLLLRFFRLFLFRAMLPRTVLGSENLYFRKAAQYSRGSAGVQTKRKWLALGQPVIRLATSRLERLESSQTSSSARQCIETLPGNMGLTCYAC